MVALYIFPFRLQTLPPPTTASEFRTTCQVQNKCSDCLCSFWSVVAQRLLVDCHARTTRSIGTSTLQQVIAPYLTVLLRRKVELNSPNGNVAKSWLVPPVHYVPLLARAVASSTITVYPKIKNKTNHHVDSTVFMFVQ